MPFIIFTKLLEPLGNTLRSPKRPILNVVIIDVVAYSLRHPVKKPCFLSCGFTHATRIIVRNDIPTMGHALQILCTECDVYAVTLF